MPVAGANALGTPTVSEPSPSSAPTSDVEELGGTSDTDKAGADTPMLRWNSTRVPMLEDELAALESAYQAHMNTFGSPFGFVAALLDA